MYFDYHYRIFEAKIRLHFALNLYVFAIPFAKQPNITRRISDLVSFDETIPHGFEGILVSHWRNKLESF